MAIHQRAGQIANQTDLVNIPKLMSHYYSITPNMDDVQQRVTFGTSGHRGCAFNGSFNQQHIWAITQAVVDYRQSANIDGPLILGIDTHALSYAAYLSAIEVLAANKVTVKIQQNDGFTPTPVVSHGVICANREANITGAALSDGLIITPSHNPPQDGGIKYNPPHGGPAEGNITAWIESRANDYLRQALAGVQKLAYAEALASGYVNAIDLITPYVADLENVIDMQAIAKAKLRIGVDPLGGSGIFYWAPIATRYGLDITLVNDKVDPSFSFMPLDKDGKIRMDCSSPYAMAGLLAHKESFDLCLGNDPDYDRHGIVCPGTGLMDPNHYLAVAIDYLLTHRPDWSDTLAIGKTLVSSALIDKICAFHGKKLLEVPVGFKWFVDGLAEATIAFGGEESAGAAFLRRDGSTWCTDKDGFILGLLAAEILAVTGKTPGQRHQELVKQFGQSFYKRIDSPISLENKAKFALLNADTLNATVLAGETIENVLTHAPGNNAAIGGIKVTTANGWFAARPSGTEALFKIYGESFISEQHLAEIIKDAQALIDKALNA
ncbi:MULTISPECIES: phosphoglucomutase (alpha-D-glucose-1,6-bisphosphate-dependent) [unclassified Shewanella]|uniref:phosphoglucomutase (alpha-D-glucose-1,6-bisphosphate-dependent) n=1 Tax=Shewanella TaxID=22 RepID=UPI0021D8B41F|nr:MULTISPECIES: phosphoglucomutase (alpha-D-glucose-1,6-bisphosphate-dependent) [unclassified Shewanella]MCU8020106.1 phosphoglucomutase (alpha-D-glucose-1,6-bisphosphate-dependent) [Shewanella sp. SM78]MCU8041616.1 phosphoglucomutase (alpha-D-glucose-1,6-bisphosphate-dependent) [Shewanella sp. SM68]MCU8046480.1 phosphoglucomutase (alpha-D-glucose-1,6-bisphosphate-dependent) [Shewanella sp. SM65]MCU8077434.1 phosphoglucomutase (alpha-D-glucose-1,6-bisphosphate-dependent) [Shewanella sp. SM103]